LDFDVNIWRALTEKQAAWLGAIVRRFQRKTMREEGARE
jgi:hypothetical protein